MLKLLAEASCIVATATFKLEEEIKEEIPGLIKKHYLAAHNAVHIAQHCMQCN